MKTIKRVIFFLFLLYLLNRIEIYLVEYLNQYIAVDLHSLKIDFDEWQFQRGLKIDSWPEVLVRIVPFNIMYLYSMLFIIPLNILCLGLYMRFKNYEELRITSLKNYYSYMIFSYVISYVIFFILRGLYFDFERGFAKTGDGMLFLLCESYIPYNPKMISGFLLGNIVFGIVLVYLIEPLMKKYIS